jgi:anti-anti-sigma factor
MALSIRAEPGRSFSTTLHLAGRLDNESVEDLDREVDRLLDSPLKVLVFDLGGLEYISSAGLRTFFRAQKVMKQRAGKALFLNPQPQVRKVFDIAKAADLDSIFRDVRELDAYLDAMQKRVTEGGAE